MCCERGVSVLNQALMELEVSQHLNAERYNVGIGINRLRGRHDLALGMLIV